MSEQLLPRHLVMTLTAALVGLVAAFGLAPLAGAAVAAPVDTPPLAAAVDVPAVPAPAPAAPIKAAAPAAPLPDLLVRQQAAGLDCHLTAAGVPLCHHGEDLTPRSITAAGGPTNATPTSGRVGCYGTGDDGPRVRAVYARPQTAPDRYAASVASIRGWAAGVSSQFDTSASRTGGNRHVRFATSSGTACSITVLNVVLPDAAFGSFSATIDALQARGLDRLSSKYLVWSDSSRYCGLATMYSDDRAGADNLNNAKSPSYARVDRGCWGKVEAHELVHMLGGIQVSAPNATGAYHCNDGLDLMCYDDGSAGSAQRSVCASAQASQLDCRNDDYFSTAAPAGSYLATHWNTARSSFLAATLADAASSSAAPRPTTSPSPSPSPSGPPPAVETPFLRQDLVSVPPLPPVPSAAPAALTAVLTAVTR